MTPEWAFQALWFGAGIGGTGAVWYFLSQRDYHTALWVGFATIVVVCFTIALHIRNDLLHREATAPALAAVPAQITPTRAADSSLQPAAPVEQSSAPEIDRPVPEQPVPESAPKPPNTTGAALGEPSQTLPAPPEAVPQAEPRGLSALQCETLATLLQRGRASLNKLVAERASDAARAEASSIQNEIRDWLGQNLGVAYAEAFMSAEPAQLVPSNYPYRYGGIYQHMRGRLTYLTSVVGQFCR
jgi:hypothetical protein